MYDRNNTLMSRIQKIITRNGDRGMSDLPGYDAKISKGSVIFECIGSIDEANSYIGLSRELLKAELAEFSTLLDSIQNDLFDLGADVIKITEKVGVDQIQKLEDAAFTINDKLPALDSFVIPQGISSPLHVARVNVRKAERKYWELCDTRNFTPHDDESHNYPGIYLNRLSDLLFILGRHVHRPVINEEKIWKVDT